MTIGPAPFVEAGTPSNEGGVDASSEHAMAMSDARAPTFARRDAR